MIAHHRKQPDLNATRWIWLRSTRNLKLKQQEQIDSLENRNLKTAASHQLRPTVQELFTLTDRHQGATLLERWINLAKESGPRVKVAYAVQNHWDGILCWFETHLSNGTLDGFNKLPNLE
ncbi:MAG: transposase [Methylovulum sp.]|nr:transposase [Methylovulum sp.]